MDDETHIIARLVYGLAGAFLGALIALSSLWLYFDLEPSVWPIVTTAAGIGFLMGALGGSRAIALLKEIWWWAD